MRELASTIYEHISGELHKYHKVGYPDGDTFKKELIEYIEEKLKEVDDK